MDGHDLWIGYPTGYARGGLDPDERAAFEVHVEHCARCRADLRLAEAPLPPPDRAGEALAPPSRAPASAAWLVAAGALVVAFGAVGLTVRERAARVAAEASAAGAFDVAAASERTAASLDSAATAADSLLTWMLGADVRVATLVTADGAATGTLYWDRTRSRLLLTAHDLPAAPADRVYRLWAVGSAQPVAIGEVEPVHEGPVVQAFALLSGLAPDRVALTLGPDSAVVPGETVLTARFGR